MANASSESAQLAKLQINIESNIKSVFDSFQKLFKIVKQADKDGFTPIRKNSDNWKKNVEGIHKTQKDINVRMKEYNDTTAKSSKQMQGLQKNAEAIKTAFSFLKGRAGLLVGGFGIGAMVSGTKAWRTELLALNETFSSMSDATGSTNAAMGVYFNALGKTKAGQQTVIASMKALEDQGLKVGKEFADLTVLGADLSQATGISADTWGNLTGKLNFSWKVPVEGIKKINSALISTGLTGSQLTQVINGVNENIDKLAGFAKDGTKNAIALAAGYAGATKALTKFGISTQKATEFMNKLLDPEHLQDNMLLLAKAGISYSDFTNMLTSDKGKETFFDKLGAGLPRVAQQLQQIQDPISRMNFAKSLGISTEMVAKLASAGPGEMQKIMREAINEAKTKDALDKKQKASKEAAAKLDERLHLMRMQLFSGLLPIFERNLPKFMNVLNLVFQRGGDIFKFVGERLESIFGNVAPVFESMLKGNWDEVPKKMGEGFKNITADIMNAVSNTVMPLVGKFIASALPNMIKGMGAALRGIWEASPIMGIIATIYTGAKIFGPAIQLYHVLKAESQRERMIAAINNNFFGGKNNLLSSKNIRKGPSTITDILKDFILGEQKASRIGLGGKQVIQRGGILSSLGRGIASIGSGIGDIFSSRGGNIIGIFSKIGPMLGNIARFAGPIGIAIGAITGAFTAMGNASKYFNQGDFYSNISDEQRARLKSNAETEHNKMSLMERQKVGASGESKELNAFKMTTMLSGEYKDSQVTGGNKTRAFGAGLSTLGIGPLIDNLFGTKITESVAKNLSMAGPIGMAFDGIAKVSDSFSDKTIPENILAEQKYFETKMLQNEQLTKEEKKRYEMNRKEIAKSKTTFYEGLKNLGKSIGDFFSGPAKEEIEKAKNKDNTDKKADNKTSWFENVFKKIRNAIEKHVSIPWFNFTYGASLALKKMGLGIKEAINPLLSKIGMGWNEQELKAESDKLQKTEDMFYGKGQFSGKGFKDAYDKKRIGQQGNAEAMKEFKAIAVSQGITDELRYNAQRAYELYKDEYDTKAEENAAKQMEILRRTEQNTRAGAGYGKQIAENTKQKTERENINNWVDFLRNSGMVEAGVY